MCMVGQLGCHQVVSVTVGINEIQGILWNSESDNGENFRDNDYPASSPCKRDIIFIEQK